MSHVPCHVSRVTCQVSCVIIFLSCFFFFSLDKVGELVGEGSVINGATPSSLIYKDAVCRIAPASEGLSNIALHCSAVQYSTVEWSTVHCSAVQYSAVHWSAVQCSTVECSMIFSLMGVTRTAPELLHLLREGGLQESVRKIYASRWSWNKYCRSLSLFLHVI